MNNLFKLLNEMTINTFILFLYIKDYPTLSKMMRKASKLSYSCIQNQLKFLESKKLIKGNRSGREYIYTYTYKGTHVFKSLKKFITTLNKTENELREEVKK